MSLISNCSLSNPKVNVYTGVAFIGVSAVVTAVFLGALYTNILPQLKDHLSLICVTPGVPLFVGGGLLVRGLYLQRRALIKPDAIKNEKVLSKDPYKGVPWHVETGQTVKADKLAELKKITHIQFTTKESLTEEILERLVTKCPNLTHLIFSGTEIECSLKPLAKLRHLVSIKFLEYENVNLGKKIDLADLEPCKALKQLAVSGKMNNFENAKAIRQLNLQSVEFHSCELKPGPFTTLLNSLPNLATLSISGNHIDQGMMSVIGQANNLTELELNNCFLEDQALEDAQFPQKLKKLSLNGNNLLTMDALIPKLMELEDLTELDLTSTSLNDAAVKELSKKPLKAFLLARTDVTFISLGALGSVRTLQVLDLSYTNMDSDRAFPLKDLPDLEVLILDHIFQSNSTGEASDMSNFFSDFASLKRVGFTNGLGSQVRQQDIQNKKGEPCKLYTNSPLKFQLRFGI